MRNHNIKNYFLTALLLIAGSGLVLYPEALASAIEDGLQLCVHVLLPTLFPFLIFSILLIKCGAANKLVCFLEKHTPLPGNFIMTFFLGVLGGSPTGAKTIVSLYQDHQCSKDEAERLLSCCSNCGIGFIIGTVGYTQFNSLKCGFFLLMIHLISAILIGKYVLFLPCKKSITNPKNKEIPSFTRAFVDSTKEAMYVFIDLSSFVLCFSAVTKLTQISGFPSILAEFMPFSNGNSENLLIGLLELTRGIANLQTKNLNEGLVLASVLLGWGGLSVHCQVLSLLGEVNLSPVFYFKGKTAHALISAALTLFAVTNSAIFFTTVCLAFLIPKKAVEKPGRLYYNIKKRAKEL